MPPTRPPAARTVSDGAPATRSKATGATERSFVAASQFRGAPTPPTRSLRPLSASYGVTRHSAALSTCGCT